MAWRNAANAWAPAEAGRAITVVTKGEVIRAVARGARWSLSIRFVGLDEKHEDRIRRRVFQALREERARLSD